MVLYSSLAPRATRAELDPKSAANHSKDLGDSRKKKKQVEERGAKKKLRKELIN